MSMRPTVIIRADGNREIGSGHVMRCSAIAVELEALGCRAIFAVADGEGQNLVEARGFECRVLGGSRRSFGADDARTLANLAKNCGATAVLVDSYAVTDCFLKKLSGRGVACAYVDDMYTFADGAFDNPQAWPADIAVNYSFYADEGTYARAYAGVRTNLLLGPKYAPVRSAFRCSPAGYDEMGGASENVNRILVTSGATNPERALERMAGACLQTVPRAALDVVVGSLASFDDSAFQGSVVAVHRGVDDLSALMAQADIAVSAAGSTLYELCCMGVPTVALPIVENQLPNARGFVQRGLGLAIDTLDWNATNVVELLKRMKDKDFRRQLSERTRSEVDGLGARRIAQVLANLVESSTSLPEFR